MHLGIVQVVLNAVNSVANTEPRIDDTLDNCHLFLVRVLLSRIVEGGHWHEDGADDSFLCDEVLHSNTEGQVTEEVDLVKNFLEVLALKLIEKVRVLRLMSQVDLQVLALWSSMKDLRIIDLALDHCKHAVADAHNREVTLCVLIVDLRPLQNTLHGLCVAIVLVRRNQAGRVTRNIQTVKLIKNRFQLLDFKIKVNGDDTSAGRLKIFDMRRLDVLLLFERVFIARVTKLLALLINELLPDALELAVPKSIGGSGIRARQRLGEHANNRRLGVLAHMMSSSNHRRVAHLVMLALLVVHVLLAVYNN